jgi:hypothetical protein
MDTPRRLGVAVAIRLAVRTTTLAHGIALWLPPASLVIHPVRTKIILAARDAVSNAGLSLAA